MEVRVRKDLRKLQWMVACVYRSKSSTSFMHMYVSHTLSKLQKIFFKKKRKNQLKGTLKIDME